MRAAHPSRRSFLAGLAATSALAALPGRALAQALPSYTITPAVSTTGRMVVSSVTMNGSSTALSIGDRVILSRAATQVAKSAATRAIANRTMGLVAARLLAAAAPAGPWALAAVAAGAVAYGAYRYFTADDEAAGTGLYSVSFDQAGANSAIRTALGATTTCAGLPANGGTYPDTIVLGAFNGSSGCLPGVRIKVVAQCTSAALAGMVPTPTGWSRAHTADKGYVDQANGIKEWWVFFTRNFPGNSTSGWGEVVQPSTLPATVPQALPATVTTKAPSPQIVADLANGVWQQAVPSSDPAALPWSSTNTATATVSPPTIKPGATTVADPAPGTVGDLSSPRPAVLPTSDPVAFTYPESVVFPDDATTPTPTPTPSPSSSPSSSGSTTINWGTPPPDVPLPTVTPMSWFPSPFTAPTLSGTCSGWTIPVPAVGGSVVLDPCPSLATLTPIVRPVCIVSATVMAGKVLMDV